ncbi:MAG: lipoyl(octanoyl) transferase LipB [Chloroflexota bacterium]
MQCKLIDLELIDYHEAWQLQTDLATQIAAGTHPASLLLLEHPHTFTFGRRGDLKNLLWNESELSQRDIAVHWVDRGGDVTYHGPGQLVGYPLLQLGKPVTGESHIPVADYVGYVRKLEESLILALFNLGLVAGQISGMTGVWVQPDIASRCPRCSPQDRLKPAKIAAIGVKVDANGISRHGFALNVNPDMSYWEGIIACGLVDHPIVSLADLLVPTPDMQTVKSAVSTAFAEVFGVSFI